MRLVERGDLVSQCNISSLPALASGKQLTLDGFELDIRKALGDDFGSFVESKQELSENQLAVLRVVVAGMVQEVPIEWVYYHLTDATGRRVSLVFTHESAKIEQFAAADRSIVASFRMMEPKLGTEKAVELTPASQQAKAKTGTAKK
jgi:hypothetical protein